MRNLYWFSRDNIKTYVQKFNKVDLKRISFVADFETAIIDNEEEVRPVISTFALLNIKKKFVNNFKPYAYYHLGYNNVIEMTLNKMIDIVKFSKSKGKIIDIWYNNSSKFDNEFILDWLIENGYEQTLNAKIFNGQFKMLAGNNVAMLELEFMYKDYTFIIRDLIRFTTMSIDKLGNIVGIKKQVDIGKKYYDRWWNTMEEWEVNEYVEYAKSDIHVMFEGFKLFHKFISLNTVKKTIPSYALEDWKNRDSSKKEYLRIGIDNWNTNHYFGGFSLINPKHKGKLIEGNIKCYDINSAYPFAMTQKLPVQEIEKDNGDCYKLYKLRIKSGKVKSNLVPIIRDVRHSNTFFENIDKHFIYDVWEIELKYFEMYYDDLEYEILEIKYFAKDNVFTNYINYWYSIKETSSKILDDIDRNNSIYEHSKSYYEMQKYVSKLMMNSLYGKFGQKPIFDFYYVMDNKYEKNDITQIAVKSKDFGWDMKNVRIQSVKQKDFAYNKVMYEVRELNEAFETKLPAKANNIYIASFITAFVRCILFDVIMSKEDKFLYSDTDSIYCLDTIDNKYLDEFELGKWKLEREDSYFKCLGSKCYITSKTREVSRNRKNTKVVIAGVNNYEVMYDCDIDKFDYGNEFSKTSAKVLKRGKIIKKVVHIIKEKKYVD